jgi:hypothetical protein
MKSLVDESGFRTQQMKHSKWILTNYCYVKMHELFKNIQVDRSMSVHQSSGSLIILIVSSYYGKSL